MQSLLETVELITTGDRRRDYGKPLVNHIRIAIIWSVYLNQVISPVDVAYMMSGLKLAREAQTPKYDNAVDNAGYMVCIDSMIDDWIVYRNNLISKEGALEELKKLSVGEMFNYLLLTATL